MTYKEHMDAEFERGIEIFTDDRLEDNIAKEIIVDKLKNKFNVSDEVASGYIERCNEKRRNNI